MFLSGKATQHLLIAALIVLFSSQVAAAQSRITLDSDRCGSDLEIISALSGVQIKSTTVPRRFLGKCEAQGIQISLKKPSLRLEIDQLKWPGGVAKSLSKGMMPRALRISARGIRVERSPATDPTWVFIETQSHGPGGLEADLSLSYSPEESTLDLRQLSLSSPSGGSVSLNAELTGISRQVINNPLLLLGGLAKRLDVQVIGRSEFMEGLAMALLSNDLETQSMDELKAIARKYVQKELTFLLARDDLNDLRRSLREFPRLSGMVSAGLRADRGLPMARVALLLNGAKPDWAADGVTLSFSYGPMASVISE